MIGFLLYALTAAVALFGYLLFDLMFHPLAAAVPSPVNGAIVLFAAALLNFWKRRVAAGAALLGAILLWRTCVFVLYAGLGLVLGFVFIVLPAVLVFSFPLVVTTVYSVLGVTNMHPEMKLPKWLFSEDREIGQVIGRARPQLPRSLQQARILLYVWWGIVFTYVASQFRPAPLEFGLPFWIAQIALLAAMLWIVVEVTNGKRWARYALVFLFALSLRSLAHLLVSPRSRIDVAVVLVALALLSTALALVFNKESASYFSQPRV